jgi:hypothetical protein
VKIKKEPKADIMAFYQGGMKFHAATTHSKEELEGMIERALNEKQPYVKLDTINEDDKIEDDSLTFLFSGLCFYSVLQNNTSPIINLPGIVQ